MRRFFERGTRRLRLTSFGEAIAVRIREILHAVDELDEYARAAQAASLRRLRLGVIPTIAPSLLPALISNLTAIYRGIDGSSLSTLVQMVGAGFGVTLIPVT